VITRRCHRPVQKREHRLHRLQWIIAWDWDENNTTAVALIAGRGECHSRRLLAATISANFTDAFLSYSDSIFRPCGNAQQPTGITHLISLIKARNRGCAKGVAA
jgi:hypothetical protein